MAEGRARGVAGRPQLQTMVGEDVRPEVVSQLEDALESDAGEEKDFHVRQALQLLEVGREGSDERKGGDEAEETGEEKEKDEAEESAEEGMERDEAEENAEEKMEEKDEEETGEGES